MPHWHMLLLLRSLFFSKMETSYDLWAEIKKVEQIKLITNRQSAITQQRRRPFVFTELSFPPYEVCFYFFLSCCVVG